MVRFAAPSPRAACRRHRAAFRVRAELLARHLRRPSRCSRRTRWTRASSSAFARWRQCLRRRRSVVAGAAGGPRRLAGRHRRHQRLRRARRHLVGGLAGTAAERRGRRHQRLRVHRPQAERRPAQRDRRRIRCRWRSGQKVLVIAGNQARVVPDYTVNETPEEPAPVAPPQVRRRRMPPCRPAPQPAAVRPNPAAGRRPRRRRAGQRRQRHRLARRPAATSPSPGAAAVGG